MAGLPVEIGQSFYKTDSHWIVWTLDSFIKNTKPEHVRLIMHDDPTMHIIVSIDVLRDPRQFQRIATDH